MREHSGVQGMVWRQYFRVVGWLARSPVLQSPCRVLEGEEKTLDVFDHINFMIIIAVCICF
jgi:hypothetical protein